MPGMTQDQLNQSSSANGADLTRPPGIHITSCCKSANGPALARPPGIWIRNCCSECVNKPDLTRPPGIGSVKICTKCGMSSMYSKDPSNFDFFFRQEDEDICVQCRNNVSKNPEQQ